MKGKAYLAVVAVLLADAPAVTQSAFAQDASKGEAVFKRCRACHAIGPAATNKAGPALTGVVGRKAGTAPGFNYSDAMLKAGRGGLVWSADKLSQYLAAPDAYLPGNVMAFPGIKNDAERADLIAFLKLHK